MYILSKGRRKSLGKVLLLKILPNFEVPDYYLYSTPLLVTFVMICFKMDLFLN